MDEATMHRLQRWNGRVHEAISVYKHSQHERERAHVCQDDEDVRFDGANGRGGPGTVHYSSGNGNVNSHVNVHTPSSVRDDTTTHTTSDSDRNCHNTDDTHRSAASSHNNKNSSNSNSHRSSCSWSCNHDADRALARGQLEASETIVGATCDAHRASIRRSFRAYQLTAIRRSLLRAAFYQQTPQGLLGLTRNGGDASTAKAAAAATATHTSAANHHNDNEPHHNTNNVENDATAAVAADRPPLLDARAVDTIQQGVVDGNLAFFSQWKAIMNDARDLKEYHAIDDDGRKDSKREKAYPDFRIGTSIGPSTAGDADVTIAIAAATTAAAAAPTRGTDLAPPHGRSGNGDSDGDGDNDKSVDSDDSDDDDDESVDSHDSDDDDDESVDSNDLDSDDDSDSDSDDSDWNTDDDNDRDDSDWVTDESDNDSDIDWVSDYLDSDDDDDDESGDSSDDAETVLLSQTTVGTTTNNPVTEAIDAVQSEAHEAGAECLVEITQSAVALYLSNNHSNLSYVDDTDDGSVRPEAAIEEEWRQRVETIKMDAAYRWYRMYHGALPSPAIPPERVSLTVP